MNSFHFPFITGNFPFSSPSDGYTSAAITSTLLVPQGKRMEHLCCSWAATRICWLVQWMCSLCDSSANIVSEHKLELHYIFCAAPDQCTWEQTKWLAQGHYTNQWCSLIQSFSESLQSSRAPSSCPHRLASSFTHLFGKQTAERMLLQTRVLEKSFLLDPKSQPQESIRISKSNKL